jgi:hypothetical protein
MRLRTNEVDPAAFPIFAAKEMHPSGAHTQKVGTK